MRGPGASNIRPRGGLAGGPDRRGNRSSHACPPARAVRNKKNTLSMYTSHMRNVFAVLTILLSLSIGFYATAQDKQAKPPAKVEFTTKNGNVTFDHAKHLERAGGKCETCHPSLFPQSKAPINFKANIHKTAEE